MATDSFISENRSDEEGDSSPTALWDENSQSDQYEKYSVTPPRTRIARRKRERRQRKEASGLSKTSLPKKPLSRRNTVGSTYEELMYSDPSPTMDSDKKADKRSMKLLRGSERDLKLDINSAQLASGEKCSTPRPKTSQPCLQIEGCRRFFSLLSKRVSCPQTKASALSPKQDDVDSLNCPKTRIEFHKTLSLLIRMGCNDKSVSDRHPRRVISREEVMWQTELKDLIWLELQAWHADRTPAEQDSYLCSAREFVADFLNSIMTFRFQKHSRQLSSHSSDSGVEEDCSGCLSMYCQPCMEAHGEALREVEKMLIRLEEVEALFPSSKAFSEFFPLYSSPEFVGRVKAMCLWYNMSQHLMLKLVILGRLLMLEEIFDCSVPFTSSEMHSDATSPSDSSSSASSVNDFLSVRTPIVIQAISALENDDVDSKPNLYRKYIESMLKTRGLMKSLNFLECMHKRLLRKAQITLGVHDKAIYTKIPDDCEDEELARYGVWSPEAQSLALPSYKSVFIFLSRVPLEVIYEFMCMRLEQKPENPSPLSIRQLLRELKEGLRVATTYRERVIKYTYSALREPELLKPYKEKLNNFDEVLLQVFELHLEYVKQWALLQHSTFQKTMLEDEWEFSHGIVDGIPGGREAAATQFCYIVSSILTGISERLLGRIQELLSDVHEDTSNKQCLFRICREIQSLFNEERERYVKIASFAKTIAKSGVNDDDFDVLKKSAVNFKCTIPTAIEKVEVLCDLASREKLDEADKASLISKSREVLQQGFKFGFEFFKEIPEFVPSAKREKLARGMIHFAQLWMRFVKERCDPGRGMRPRWAYQGLEFLLSVCDPQITVYLAEDEFEELKNNMDACISHVIGTTAPSTPDSGIFTGSPRTTSLDYIRTMPRSRGTSPNPRTTYRSQRSVRKTSSEQQSPIADHVDDLSVTNSSSASIKELPEVIVNCPITSSYTERVKEAIDSLDHALDERLREQDLIGKVVSRNRDQTAKAHIRQRYVKFKWQRGIKIGQGRFGKVYTAVNIDTGEMMAVKEIALQPNDCTTIRKVAEEFKILEGIAHRNLVKYYGLEVHREELLLFMEFCPEGTLENLVAGTENGLPEMLVRKYTYQLLCGVAELHNHGIVHRDIKTANIFLAEGGNCLKIGDFGCAVKIKAHTTMPGELKGLVGTQAYMAPELFTRSFGEQNRKDGYGRAADIWSVGCVVVEMASGKRPWAEFDANFQIIFKVGSGERPKAPDSLIEEGHDFIDRCLQHNPRNRSTAAVLLDHNFVKIGED